MALGGHNGPSSTNRSCRWFAPRGPGVLTRQLERSSHGLLPALGIRRHQGQARQPQDESELARSEGHRGHQVAGSHHVELHCRGREERRQGVSAGGRAAQGWVSLSFLGCIPPSALTASLVSLFPPHPGSVYSAPRPAPSPGVRCKGHSHRAEGGQSSAVGEPQRPGQGHQVPSLRPFWTVQMATQSQVRSVSLPGPRTPPVSGCEGFCASLPGNSHV